MAEDLFEIGSLLQGKDREKELLERRLHTLRASIASQEGRLQHEIEQHEKVLREQKGLLRKIKEKNTYVEAFSTGLFQQEEERNLSKVKQCESQVAESIQMVENLENDFNLALSQIMEIDEILMLLNQDDMKCLKEKLEEEEKIHAEFEEMIENAISRLKAMDEMLKGIRESQMQLAKNRDDTMASIATLKKQLNDIFQEKLTASEQITTREGERKEEFSILNQELQTVDQEIKKLQDEDLTTCNKKLEKQQVDEEAYQQRLTTAKSSLESSLKTISTQDTEIEDQITQYEGMLQNLNSESEEISLKRGEINSLKKEAEKMNIKKKNLESKSVITSAGAGVGQELKELMERKTLMEEEIKSIRRQLDVDNAEECENQEVKNLTGLLKTKDEYMRELSEKVEHINESLRSAETEMESVTKRKEEMANEDTLLKAEIEAKEKMKMDLLAQLKEVEVLIARENVEDEAGKVAGDRGEEDVKEVLENLVTELESIKQSLAKKEAEVSSAESLRNEIQNELAASKQRLMAAQEASDQLYYQRSKEEQVRKAQSQLLKAHQDEIEHIRATLTQEDKEFQAEATGMHLIQETKKQLQNELASLRFALEATHSHTEMQLATEFDEENKQDEYMKDEDMANADREEEEEGRVDAWNERRGVETRKGGDVGDDKDEEEEDEEEEGDREEGEQVPYEDQTKHRHLQARSSTTSTHMKASGQRQQQQTQPSRRKTPTLKPKEASSQPTTKLSSHSSMQHTSVESNFENVPNQSKKVQLPFQGTSSRRWEKVTMEEEDDEEEEEEDENPFETSLQAFYKPSLVSPHHLQHQHVPTSQPAVPRMRLTQQQNPPFPLQESQMHHQQQQQQKQQQQQQSKKKVYK